MNVRTAYYVIALAISLAAYSAADAKAAYTIATAVSLASFAGAFILGERTRHTVARRS
jgi:hypothetical protein